jgi:hypothetical protein
LASLRLRSLVPCSDRHLAGLFLHRLPLQPYCQGAHLHIIRKLTCWTPCLLVWKMAFLFSRHWQSQYHAFQTCPEESHCQFDFGEATKHLSNNNNHAITIGSMHFTNSSDITQSAQSLNLLLESAHISCT